MKSNCLRIPISKPAGAGPRWSLCAVGDVCALVEQCDPSRRIAERFEHEFQTLIQSAEISIVNLEAPTCRAGEPIPKSGPPLRMDASVPAGLRTVGFDVATLANNHIMDYGRAGLDQTLTACKQAGLTACGAGNEQEHARRAVVLEPVEHVRVAVLAFCEREFGVALNGSAGTAWLSEPETLDAVRRAKEAADVVIVVAHGGAEVVPLPPPQRREQLRRLIDAGATLVIGHHPHVPQAWERYGEGVILYSLGNCLFDYADGEKLPKTDWGLAATATFEGDSLSELSLLLTEQRGGVVGLLEQVNGHWEYLNRLCEITNDSRRLEAHWQEIAAQLFEDRYLPYLCYALRMPKPNLGIKADARRLLGSVARKFGWRRAAGTNEPRPELHDPLLLLNMVRNESHRWSIATALELIGRDAEDRRDPQIRRAARELLNWTLD